jgi:hypothetical protein
MQTAVLHCRRSAHFSYNMPRRGDAFQHISDFYFTTSIKRIRFYLALGAPFAFWKADFHKIKVRETADHMI